jgi:hypothetical protein
VNYILRLGALVAIIGLVVQDGDKANFSTIPSAINSVFACMAIATFVGLAVLMFFGFQRMNDAIIDALIDDKRFNHLIIFDLLAAFPTLASIFMWMSIFAALKASR